MIAAVYVLCVLLFHCPPDVVIHTTDAEAEAAASGVCDEEKLEAVQKAIPSLEALKGLTLTPLDFEKVDKCKSDFFSQLVLLMCLFIKSNEWCYI